MWEKQGGGETWGEKGIGKGGNRRKREMAIWKFLAIGKHMSDTMDPLRNATMFLRLLQVFHLGTIHRCRDQDSTIINISSGPY